MERLLACVLKSIASITLVSFLLSTPLRDNKEINIWHKVSTDEANPGVIVTLDMSRGYSYSKGGYIFIVIREVGSMEEFVVVFPNGGYWAAPVQDPFLKELDKEFNDLEQYLRNKGVMGIIPTESQEIRKD